jgi:hypothetical protein
MRLQPNDVVVFAHETGTWKIVAAVNGSKQTFAEARVLTLASLQPGSKA